MQRPSRSFHLLALALLAVACDDAAGPELEQLREGDTTSSTDSTSGGVPEPGPACEVESCCGCVAGDLVCVASNALDCQDVADAIGTVTISLPCQALDGALDCPSLDCSPPEAACCSCIAGESQCIEAPSEGCSSGWKPVAGCEVDVVGDVTCESFAC
jgi:hypothetical protein